MTYDFPILPLDLWRREIGYSPWHFWGLADNNIVPVTSKCNDVVREYGWQSTDEAGRADIRTAIINAEKIFLDNVSYYPAPVYAESTVPWPRYNNPALYRTNRVDSSGRWIPVQLPEGYVHNTGVETHTLISALAAIAYSDLDGDGIAESWVVTAPTSVTNPDEIAVYFSPGDRLIEDSSLSARWRIEPVNVSIAAGTVTIYGKRWLMVKPLLYEDKAHFPIDPTVNANFATTVDIYRRYTYTDGQVSTTNSQAALIWETRPCCWGCNTVASSTDPASEGWVAGRCGIRDSYNGIVTPGEAVYDAVTGKWASPCSCIDSCGEPDRVLVRHFSGHPLDRSGWMAKSIRTIISRLAAAEMTRRICACDTANREFYNWQFDVSRVEGPETYQANLDALNNPIGTRRGHIYAWQQMTKLARVSGILS